MKTQFIIPLLLILLIFSSQSCACKVEELKRESSPDNKVDYVLVRQNCHATTPFAYFVYIVPKGGTPSKKNIVFTSEKLEGENIFWRKPKLLEIQYKKAHIYNFTNFWYSKDVDNFNYVVEIRETPLEESSIKIVEHNGE